MRTEAESRAGAPLLRAVPSSLEDLVRRAGEHDTAAFHELFERYSDRVFRYAHVRLGRSDDANDLVQDVFLAVWTGLPTFRYEHEGSFPGWLFKIAARRVGDRLRHRARHAVVPLEEASEASMEFEGLAVSRRLLVEGLARLPDRQREVLVLRFVAGLPVKQIALATDRSEAAVTSLQMRGLERLRRYMGEDE